MVTFTMTVPASKLSVICRGLMSTLDVPSRAVQPVTELEARTFILIEKELQNSSLELKLDETLLSA